jgi:NitT/TauT family transport system ATP-binding protein
MQVSVHSARVTYEGAIAALDGVRLDIAPGQFVSVVGPSGCGKSTLLRLIAGLIQPSSGSVSVSGQSPRAARRSGGLAFVFQDATLLPWRSLAANVGLPLELERVPGRKRAQLVSRALDLVALGEFARRYPDQLSGGMRMRASLARAIVTQPKLMLLDEPFGALDDITRQMLNEELANLWARDRWTGVFVTHNIAEAVFLSERVLVMSPRPGRIVAEVPIPFDFPRDPALRARGEFAKLTGEVSRHLRGALA